MGGHGIGTVGLASGTSPTELAATAKPASAPPAWNRFAHWRPGDARAGLFGFVLLLILSALVPIEAGRQDVATHGLREVVAGTGQQGRQRDRDLALYDRASERIAGGEHYYDFILEEQRAAGYPVRPGLAVRLPTLAYLNAWAGETGQKVAAILLMLAVLAAWWRRLGGEPGVADRRRLLAFALIFLGASVGLTRHFFALHELWAGMLLALSFGLHRTGKGRDEARWGGALAVAALALAIRELALPFVLLMAAMAFWRRGWREAFAWCALATAFLLALALHLHTVAQQVGPADPAGQGWMYLRGLSGWLSNIALSGNLRFFPHWLAGPIVVLTLLGWCAWRSPAGAFGALLFLGYGLAFMIAGRPDNYYWGMMVTPVFLAGLAFAPMGLKSLVARARGRTAHAK